MVDEISEEFDGSYINLIYPHGPAKQCIGHWRLTNAGLQRITF